MPTTRSSRAPALVAVPVVAAVVLLGVWVAGGVISDDFRTSMALTTAWFLLSGAAFWCRAFSAPFGSATLREES